MEGNLYCVYYIKEKRTHKAHIVSVGIEKGDVIDFIIEHSYCGWDVPNSYEVKEYPPFTQYTCNSNGTITQFAFSTLSYKVAKAAIEEVGAIWDE